MRRMMSLQNSNKKAIILYVISYFLPIIFSLLVHEWKLDVYEPIVIGGFFIVLIISTVGIWLSYDIIYKRY